MLAATDEGSDFWGSGIIPQNLDNLMIEMRASFDEVMCYILRYDGIDYSKLIGRGMLTSFK